MRVEVLDLGINNLKSLVLALKRAGADSVDVLQDANQSRTSTLIVLPGVGSFGAAVDELEKRSYIELIQARAKSGVSIMGICLGMQLLGRASEETPAVAGLGLVPGISKLLPKETDMRVPNVGWYSTESAHPESPFQALSSQRDFYFVHSYHFVPDERADILCESSYGTKSFISGIHRGNVIGFQFHPEKSADVGGLLLEEVIGWARA
jgi:imidazole glycerol phosphate synthase glutamine amidotransferase subunit